MTSRDLLARHPFPAPWAAEKRIERLWVFDLAGTPEALWPHIADTSRMNRALGTAEMRFEERDGVRWGTARNGGVRHEWIELPWNWVANQWLTCLRVYERGFMRAMYSIQALEPTATGTNMDFLHEQFHDEAARDDHEGGWTPTFEKLGRFLRNPR